MKNEIQSINPHGKLSRIQDYWNPRIAAELNDSYVKLAKLLGEFDWHSHEAEDELFYVLKGELRILLRDKELLIREGEFCVIPKGVEHKPVAREEVHLMLIEPKTTLNTGNVRNEKTKEEIDWI